jgi:hypothetical protein
MARHLDYPVTIDGRQGHVIVINATTGEQANIFGLIKTSMKVSTDKKGRQPLNAPYKQYKQTGQGIEGNMTIFHASDASVFIRWAYQAKQQGHIMRFHTLIATEDKGSFVGQQVVKFINCSIDSYDLSILDIDADDLEQSFNITAEDFELLETFTEPRLTGRN